MILWPVILILVSFMLVGCGIFRRSEAQEVAPGALTYKENCAVCQSGTGGGHPLGAASLMFMSP